MTFRSILSTFRLIVSLDELIASSGLFFMRKHFSVFNCTTVFNVFHSHSS